MKFEIRRTRNNQFRAYIIADNGETLFVSETYMRRAKAEKVIGIVVAYGASAPTVDYTRHQPGNRRAPQIVRRP
jgi:uncharacterized protein YegP (UPF0339 family)